MLEKDFSPQYDGRGGDAAQNHKHLDKMPIDEMTERLTELLDSVDETTFDVEKLDALLAEMDEIDPITPEIDVESSLADFHEKHARLFEQAPPAENNTNKPVRRRFLRAALVAAVAIALMLFSMITVQALGVDVFGAIAQWTDDVFHFSVPGSEERGAGNVPAIISNSANETLQDTLTAYGINEAIVPQWFPEGFIISGIDVSTLSTNMVIRADYEFGQKQMSIFIREFFFERDADIAIGSFEKDSENTVQYNKCGVTHYIVSNNLCNTATWIHGFCVCSISGDLAVDELEKMIDSIYEGEP